MTIITLQHFPNVCRLCLYPKPAPEMVPLGSTMTEFSAQLSDILNDFCPLKSEDLDEYLPSSICEQCQMEFITAYRFKQKMSFLIEFQIAFVKMKLKDQHPMRRLFDESLDYMNFLFHEMNLIAPERSVCWDDIDFVPADTNKDNEDGAVDEILDDEASKNMFQVEMLEESSCDDYLTENSANIEVEYLDLEAEDETILADDGECNMEPRFASSYQDSFKHEIDKNTGQEEYVVRKCGIDDCEELFEFKDLLVRHKREVHQCCVCDICGIVLKNKYTLDVHVRRHRGETRFDCQYCPSSFHTTQEYKLHLGLVHVASERVKCDICGLEFKNATCLKRHLKSHSEIRSYQCPFCEKAFKTTMHLHRHKETIHLKVRFNCNYCDVSYGRKDKLRMHIERVHNIQTYFLCDICLKSFSTEDQRLEHMGHHANPKPLECATCLLAFLTQDEFDEHLCISYRDDYICCERDFKFHTFYNKHMFLVHGQKTNARVKPAVNKLIAHVRAERKQEERCFKCEKKFATRKLKNAHKKICCGKK